MAPKFDRKKAAQKKAVEPDEAGSACRTMGFQSYPNVSAGSEGQPRAFLNALRLREWHGQNEGSCFISAGLQFLLSSPSIVAVCEAHGVEDEVQSVNALWNGMSLPELALLQSCPDSSLEDYLRTQPRIDMLAATWASMKRPTHDWVLPALYVFSCYTGTQEDAMEFLRCHVVSHCPLVQDLMKGVKSRPEICCSVSGCQHAHAVGEACEYNASGDTDQWEWPLEMASEHGLTMRTIRQIILLFFIFCLVIRYSHDMPPPGSEP